jgi:hypothetical protein
MVNMNCSFKRKRPDARRLVVPGLIIALSALLLLAFPSVSFAETSGAVSAWGYNGYGQCDVPAPNSDFVAVAADAEHSLGLKSDGTVVAWGSNHYGECDVPAPNSDFVAVSGGDWHSLGLKSDGTVVAWGRNDYGQCDVPAPNSDFVAVAGGSNHSLGLKSDGTVVAWGWNDYGQCDVPAPNSDFVAVAGGRTHSLGLKSDGTVVAWGSNYSDVPAPNSDFVAVSAGALHSLGLKSDGTVVAWGFNGQGQCDVPAPNSDFVAVAGGEWHSLGLKSDGTVVAWGSNGQGQCDVPAPNSDFVAVAGGWFHSLAIHRGEPPNVSSIDPSEGVQGTTVDVTNLAGTGFQDGATVRLEKAGETAIDATDVAFVSSVKLTCKLPLLGDTAVGTWDVVVKNPDDQEGRLDDGFTVNAFVPAPTVTSITPKTGVKGWRVTITDIAGTGFQTGATVKLEQPSSSTVIDATNVNVESDTKITCKFTLSGPLGKYDVVVKNPDDQEVKLVNGFSVTNICGLGGGAIMLGFGLMMGLLSLAGSEILRKRQRRIKAG